VSAHGPMVEGGMRISRCYSELCDRGFDQERAITALRKALEEGPPNGLRVWTVCDDSRGEADPEDLKGLDHVTIIGGEGWLPPLAGRRLYVMRADFEAWANRLPRPTPVQVGRPRKQDSALAVYRKLYPNGHEAAGHVWKVAAHACGCSEKTLRRALSAG